MDADVLSGLPELTWAGLSIACDVGPFDWEHDLAERRYPYIDGAGHDHTGRRPIVANARLYFHVTVDEEAFPAKWEQWREALLSGAPDDLVHPLLGPLRARVHRVHGDLSAMIRSGTTIDVTWIETLDDPTQQATFEPVEFTLGATAAAAETAATAVGVSWPDGAPDISLTSAIDSFEGALAEAEISANGLANQIKGAVETMVDVAEALTTPSSWVAIELLQSVWLQVDAAVSKARLSSRPTARLTIARDMTLDAFASDRGNTVAEIQELNLFALRMPTVPAGTTLTYYSGS